VENDGHLKRKRRRTTVTTRISWRGRNDLIPRLPNEAESMRGRQNYGRESKHSESSLVHANQKLSANFNALANFLTETH
jgi:hypothetical protein